MLNLNMITQIEISLNFIQIIMLDYLPFTAQLFV